MSTGIEEVVERQRLKEELRASEIAERNWVKKQIREYNRLDILAEYVFDLSIEPFHREMQAFQFRHPNTLQLAPRGFGKTTTVTEMRAILEMIKDPNVRMCVVGRTGDVASSILGEVKQFLKVPKFVEIFGDFEGEKWSDTRIIHADRNIPRKEPTITTVGVEGQVVSKHFDKILGDDLIDENNSRTPHMRDQTKTFWYKTMSPTLEPDGEMHLVGTRYHPDDIYGHMMANEFADCHRILPVLDEKGRSLWPARFPIPWVKKKRKQLGSVIFDTQYMLSTDKMRGGLFEYDWMPVLSPGEVLETFGESQGRRFIGVDVSTGEEGSDMFAIVCVRVVGRQVLIEDFWEGRLRFSQQLEKIDEWFEEYDPIDVSVESNAFQAIVAQQIREKYPSIRVRPVHTDKDKVTRAHKLAARFEAGEVFFKRDQEALISHLLLFPRGRFDDLFDALDIAVTRAFRRTKKRRSSARGKIGLI